MMLIDDGVISTDQPQWQLHNAQLDRLQVPPTLTGIFQARLDGLPPPERALLQQAAVVGHIFWDAALAFLNRRQAAPQGWDDLRVTLRALSRRELVARRPTSLFSATSEYKFKHALLWEVTYETVLRRHRVAYHADVADWLIAGETESAAEVVAIIADHLEKAGRLSAAAVYWRQAAADAAARFANQEAVDFLRRALPHSEQALRVDLHDQIGRLLILLGRHQEAEKSFRDALPLAGPSDTALRSRLHLGVANSLASQQAYDAAEEQYAAALAQLGQPGPDAAAADQRQWIEIQLARGNTAYLRAAMGQLAELRAALAQTVERYGTPRQLSEFYAFSYRVDLRVSRFWPNSEMLDLADKSLKIAQTLGNERLIGDRLFGFGFCLLWSHRPEEGLPYLERALESSRRTTDVPLRDRCLAYLCIAHRLRGDMAGVAQFLAEAHELAAAEDNTMYGAVALANQAWIDYRRQATASAQAGARAALDTWLAAGATYPMLWLADAILLAVAAQQGRHAAALASAVAHAGSPPEAPARHARGGARGRAHG